MYSECVEVNKFLSFLLKQKFFFWKKCKKNSGFVCVYHPAAPCSNPKHTIYAFFNLYYWNWNEKRTKINKKRPGLAHFFKKDEEWNSQQFAMLRTKVLLYSIFETFQRRQRPKAQNVPSSLETKKSRIVKVWPDLLKFCQDFGNW